MYRPLGTDGAKLMLISISWALSIVIIKLHLCKFSGFTIFWDDWQGSIDVMNVLWECCVVFIVILLYTLCVLNIIEF
jgi:hypothetical protein